MSINMIMLIFSFLAIVAIVFGVMFQAVKRERNQYKRWYEKEKEWSRRLEVLNGARKGFEPEKEPVRYVVQGGFAERLKEELQGFDPDVTVESYSGFKHLNVVITKIPKYIMECINGVHKIIDEKSIVAVVSF